LLDPVVSANRRVLVSGPWQVFNLLEPTLTDRSFPTINLESRERLTADHHASFGVGANPVQIRSRGLERGR